MMKNFSSWLAIISYDLNLHGLYPLDSYKISYYNSIVVIIASFRIETLLYIYICIHICRKCIKYFIIQFLSIFPYLLFFHFEISNIVVSERGCFEFEEHYGFKWCGVECFTAHSSHFQR